MNILTILDIFFGYLYFEYLKMQFHRAVIVRVHSSESLILNFNEKDCNYYTKHVADSRNKSSIYFMHNLLRIMLSTIRSVDITDSTSIIVINILITQIGCTKVCVFFSLLLPRSHNTYTQAGRVHAFYRIIKTNCINIIIVCKQR